MLYFIFAFILVIVPGGSVEVVRVPSKINFVASSLTECMLVGTFSCVKKWFAVSARA